MVIVRRRPRRRKIKAGESGRSSGRVAIIPEGGRHGGRSVSWPKRASPLFRDLTEDGVRELLLPTGWVDVKVCAVDSDWSG